ncbi:outer membrane protein [Vibrio nigripulchritudo]|uniref:OMPA-like protein n=1 Tax=Vibrio nigripulchritudo TaxID=28173 RepID=A0A9P1JLE6_9VIBR|nr:outer membrane beta-barrel protein [Vibrio nigripulchritudo]CBJ93235.1 putative OMPA-like protein [Vibrio nigripulchritudo]CCN86059.1 conserved exported hypothetical protein [Vibrio nigripulchritudo BLFn1]CCN97858.1 conserved exported hypothetical protein [Vibrio nigripulchritudo ENn2]CCO44081.1 conserved exported hypothetical protein [Vibrio nigripulchritudo SFn135]CCO56168.1 conserved exported hypothetical protein [Vibrio nigripulchritudo Wn13]
MKKISVLLPLLLSSAAFAGPHHFGLKGGGARIDQNEPVDGGFTVQMDYAYQFHPNFSAELGYVGTVGAISEIMTSLLPGDKESLGYDAIFTGVKANYAPAEFVNMYAVGGANYSRFESSVTPVSGSKKVSTYEGVNPYYGAGAEFIIRETVSLSLEYRNYILEKEIQSSVILAGLNIKF